MSGYAEAAALAVVAVQAVLLSLQNYLAPGAYLCPASTDVNSVISQGSYDYIIVGGGTAGSVLAYRLAEIESISVLVLEEGGCPPMESLMPGYFTLLPYSTYDRQMNVHNDNYSCQNLKSGGITAGKVLGGSSALEHMIYVSPFASDYDSWGTAANDTSWSFPDFAKYFALGENVQDADVLEQNATLHGTSGPQVLSKQSSSSMKSILDALVEMGSTYVHDAVGACNVNFPLLGIESACSGIRQSGVVSYLSKIINNKRVTILTGATATKINFDGTAATGVQFDVDGSSYSINASKEVIVTMGAIKTPQLLMLSGIGDAAVLNKHQIQVVVDNPHVGQHLLDHTGMIIAYGMENSTETASAMQPSLFPVDMLTNYAGPSCSGPVTDQEIILRFTPNSSGFLQLCSTGFKYIDKICDAMYEYNIDRYLMAVVLNLSKPKSEGFVTLETTDITDDPLIVLNLLNDKDDLDLLAERAMEFNKIVNTTEFRKIGVEMADVGVCSDLTKDTIEYWKCYVVALSSTMWHYSGTCALGTVVDSHLTVIGTTKLKVADASVFASMPAGNIMSSVRAVAEKAADIIIADLEE